MAKRKSSIFTILAGGFLVILVTILANAQTPDDQSGDWLATLDTPMGPLRLQVHVTVTEDGQQAATLESLDQAPGQLIPISSVMITTDQFSFEVAAIGARFSGHWNEVSQSYEGVFDQGMQFTTAFSRPGNEQKVLIEDLEGSWAGELIRGDITLQFILNFVTDEGETRASMDSPAQGAYGVVITGLRQEGDVIHFQIPAASVSYEAVLNDNTLNGTWRRTGSEPISVRFERVSDTVQGPNRPQTPQAPFPYHVEDVQIENPEASGVTLAGTLTLPEGEGPFPGVVLISGSGPQDRNETVWTHQPFAVLADHLTRQGIAVLRYDDRGVAESTGEFSSATSFDLASDTQAVATFLRAHPAIRSVGLAGHSEGGLIAPIVAVQSPEIDFVILLAGPGTPGDQFVIDQTEANLRAAGENEDLITARLNTLAELIEIARTAEDSADAMARLDAALSEDRMQLLLIPAGQKQAFMANMARDWYRTLVNYDPADWVPQMHQPVLVLQGNLDLQIVAEPNVSGLRSLLAEHSDAEIVVMDGLNHLFQPAQTGQMSEYPQIETTFDPEAMDIISTWINTRFGQ